jgi:hypothetical protein
MFICQKLDARFFFIKLVLKCFQNYLILRVIYSNRIKNKQNTASKVFRQSLCIYIQYESMWGISEMVFDATKNTNSSIH